MATMSDVAKAENVSVTTVSHVLNGTRKVTPKTEQQVRMAIQRVGYTQNSLARSLAMSATNTISVAIPTFANHYFSEVVRAIENECMKNGLMMLFSDTHDDPEQELKIVQAFHQRRVDGVIDRLAHALVLERLEIRVEADMAGEDLGDLEDETITLINDLIRGERQRAYA